MSSEQRRFLNVQLAISAVLNAAISALFVWIMFGGSDAISLWGMEGLAFDLVPTTFMITFATTIALTLATRGKFGGPEPRRRLPRNPVLRALLFAPVATIALVPPTVLVLALTWTGPWSYDAVMAFKVIYGVALGFIVTPIVVRAAMGSDTANALAA
jgi:hypothetical protein